MPSSQLRVWGSKANVGRFLRTTLLPVRAHEDQRGFNLMLSAYDGKSLKTRTRLVARFLRDHRSELLALPAGGLNRSVVDLGLYDDTPRNAFFPSYRIPQAFIQLLAEFGFALKLSFYGFRDDTEDLLIIGAHYLDALRLKISFSDETSREIDFAPALQALPPDHKLAFLRDPVQFQQFSIYEDRRFLIFGDFARMIFVDDLYHDDFVLAT